MQRRKTCSSLHELTPGICRILCFPWFATPLHCWHLCLPKRPLLWCCPLRILPLTQLPTDTNLCQGSRFRSKDHTHPQPLFLLSPVWMWRQISSDWQNKLMNRDATVSNISPRAVLSALCDHHTPSSPSSWVPLSQGSSPLRHTPNPIWFPCYTFHSTLYFSSITPMGWVFLIWNAWD